MRKIVENTILKYHMLAKGDQVVIGVSGGPDSIALLHLLCQLKQAWQLDLVVAHFDHLLRSESSGEAEFVRGFAGELGLEFFTERGYVREYAQKNGLSIQVAARELRYDFLERVADKTRSQKIAIAHHLDDQGETIVMNFLRGPSPRGLAGIPPVRGKIIRPLIDVTRGEIEEYIKNNQLATVEDHSNYDKKYFRNRVRLEIIPGLKEYNPNLMAGLVKGGEIFREEDLYLEQLTEVLFNKNCIFESDKILSVSYGIYKELPLAIKRRFLRKCFIKLVDSSREMGFDEVERVATWLDKPVSGKLLEWPSGIKIKYSQGRISIGKFESVLEEDNGADFQLAVPRSGQIEINSDLFRAEVVKIEEVELKGGDPWTVFLDADKIFFPLIIRNRRDGDRFYPLGVGGRKKLKDFFIDLKIPKEKRDEILLVTSLEGEIIWVMGLRIDERYKVTEATKKILKLSLIKTIINSKLV